MILDNRDTKIKRMGNEVWVEFYEDGRMLGQINYSDKSMHYVEDAIENFMTGIMDKTTIDFYREKDNA